MYNANISGITSYLILLWPTGLIHVSNAKWKSIKTLAYYMHFADIFKLYKFC